MKKLVTVALLGIVTLGLTLPGVANADEKPLTFTEPVKEVFPNPCTGETITLTGEMVIMVHDIDDAGGGFHETFTVVPHGITAVGASGTEYRSIGAHSDSFSTGTGRATTFTLSVAFLVVSEGGTDNLVAKGTVYFTLNAKGDVTAEFEGIRADCLG